PANQDPRASRNDRWTQRAVSHHPETARPFRDEHAAVRQEREAPRMVQRRHAHDVDPVVEGGEIPWPGAERMWPELLSGRRRHADEGSRDHQGDPPTLCDPERTHTRPF